jgi:cell wall-associated NlpC family hydrolase
MARALLGSQTPGAYSTSAVTEEDAAMRLRPEEIFRFAMQAGFSPDQSVTMTAIALAESGGNPEAHNPVGEDSVGLWQVNLQAHPQYAGLDVTDPLTNARMAYEVSGGGADIGPWTVTHADNGSPYLRYQAQAEAAAAANGYPDADGQWDPPANYDSPDVNAGPADDGPPTTPTHDLDAPDAADPADAAAHAVDAADAPGLDHDSDGLVEGYEAAIGTDADAVDTDRDGFADSVEVLHHTDPLDFSDNPLVTATGDPAAFHPDLTTTTPTFGTGPADLALADADVPDTGDGGAGNDGGPLDTFLDVALSQDGAPYIFGAEVDPTTVDPKAGGQAFDCSELVEWAAARAGVDVPDGSYNQYLHLRDVGTELTVDEALRTPGALVFNFSSEPVPGAGRPATAHVAISLGNGQLIEARGSNYGVGQFDAAGREFSHAAFIPELGTELTPSLAGVDGDVVADPLPAIWDSDTDGLLDAYERLIAIDPFSADTDRDGFLDSIELSYGSDPLDFADNPLVGSGSGAGYRPPLTTEVPPLVDPVEHPGWATSGPGSGGWGSTQLPPVDPTDPLADADDLVDHRFDDRLAISVADDLDLDDVDQPVDVDGVDEDDFDDYDGTGLDDHVDHGDLP